MAMDKNEKLTLFRKVPKVDANEMLDKKDRLDFLDIQILERKKMLWREQVTVLQAEVWADEDDKDANTAAEQAVNEAKVRMKSLKLELKALEKIRKTVEAE
jgi:hypothetical protein